MSTLRHCWYFGGIFGLTLAAWLAGAGPTQAQTTLRPPVKKDTSKDTVKKDTGTKSSPPAVSSTPKVQTVRGIVKSNPVVWAGFIPGVIPSLNPIIQSPLAQYTPSLYPSVYTPAYSYMSPLSLYPQTPQLSYYNQIYPPNPFVNVTPAFQTPVPFDLTAPNGLPGFYRPPVFPLVDGFGSLGGGLGYYRGFGY